MDCNLETRALPRDTAATPALLPLLGAYRQMCRWSQACQSWQLTRRRTGLLILISVIMRARRLSVRGSDSGFHGDYSIKASMGNNLPICFPGTWFTSPPEKELLENAQDVGPAHSIN